MELSFETFAKGITILTLAYLKWNPNPDSLICWYTVIKTCIPEEYFLETIYSYCREKRSAPTCCSDLINYSFAVVIPK